jgi:hypothetical protein
MYLFRKSLSCVSRKEERNRRGREREGRKKAKEVSLALLSTLPWRKAAFIYL